MGAVRWTHAQSPILHALLDEFRKTKRLAEGAFVQLGEEDFFFRLSPRQNSIYVIVKHMAGNMHSRWTDFLTSDGEKPGRDRESEFVEAVVPRAAVMQTWERGWACVFAALEGLTDADLSRTVTIRGEPHTVVLAAVRQVAHYAYHVGQILLIAKHLRGDRWNYLTIPPGGSEAFNRDMAPGRQVTGGL
jgi:hypothetical protein